MADELIQALYGGQDQAALKRALLQAAMLRNQQLGGSFLKLTGTPWLQSAGEDLSKGAQAEYKQLTEAPGAGLDLSMGRQKMAAQETDYKQKQAEQQRLDSPVDKLNLYAAKKFVPDAPLEGVTNREFGQQEKTFAALFAAQEAAKARAAQAREAAAARGAAKAATQGFQGEQNMFRNTTKLRNELMNNPVTKNTQDVAAGFAKITKAAEMPSGAGDMSMIYAYMKMLDPGSTVREGEYATAANSGSLPDKLVSTYNKIVKGERLAPDVRVDFLNQAQNVYGAQVSRYNQLAEQYKQLAIQNEIKPEDVVLDLGFQQKQTPASVDSGIIEHNGKRYKDLGGGQFEEVD